MAYLCIELRYDQSNVLCMRKNKSILLDKNIMKCWDQSAFWAKVTKIFIYSEKKEWKYEFKIRNRALWFDMRLEYVISIFVCVIIHK